MTESTKQIKLVWPEHLWLALSNKAKKEGTSIQTIITEAVLDRYGILHWRKGSEKNSEAEKEAILDKYSYVAPDIQIVIDKLSGAYQDQDYIASTKPKYEDELDLESTSDISFDLFLER